MTVFEIENELKAGSRVTLLMRHAERPPLEPGDTSFGAQLPITDRGRQTAERFGMRLSHIVTPDKVSVYASSTLRTIQTAECILKGLPPDDWSGSVCPVVIKEVLGSDSPFFGSLEERMNLIAEGRYQERLNDYFASGVQRGYNPLVESTDKMEATLRGFDAPVGGLVLTVTHDVNIGCFLAGRKVITSFSEETWPYYLDAAVMIESPGGTMRYGVWRWDRAFDGMDLI